MDNNLILSRVIISDDDQDLINIGFDFDDLQKRDNIDYEDELKYNSLFEALSKLSYASLLLSETDMFVNVLNNSILNRINKNKATLFRCRFIYEDAADNSLEFLLDIMSEKTKGTIFFERVLINSETAAECFRLDDSKLEPDFGSAWCWGNKGIDTTLDRFLNFLDNGNYESFPILGFSIPDIQNLFSNLDVEVIRCSDMIFSMDPISHFLITRRYLKKEDIIDSLPQINITFRRYDFGEEIKEDLSGVRVCDKYDLSFECMSTGFLGLLCLQLLFLEIKLYRPNAIIYAPWYFDIFHFKVRTWIIDDLAITDKGYNYFGLARKPKIVIW